MRKALVHNLLNSHMFKFATLNVNSKQNARSKIFHLTKNGKTMARKLANNASDIFYLYDG